MERIGRLPEDNRGATRETYPLSKKATMAKEPEWKLKLEEGGTHKEIDELDYAHRQRSATERDRKKGTNNETPPEVSTATGDHFSMDRRIEIPQGKPKGNTVCATSHRRHGPATEAIPRFERKTPLKHAYQGIYRMGKRET